MTDPLEGFHFDEFDPELKKLTVRVHELILKYPKQREALLEKMAEVLAYGDEITSIEIKPRES